MFESASQKGNIKQKPVPALRCTQPTSRTMHTPNNCWVDQKHDPYSTMNVYYKKLKHGEVRIKPTQAHPESGTDTLSEAEMSYDDDFTHTHTQQVTCTHTQISIASSTHIAEPPRPASLTTESSRHTSHTTESSHPVSSHPVSSYLVSQSIESQRTLHTTADIDAVLERANQRKALRGR